MDDSRHYKLNSRDPRSRENIDEFSEYFDVFTTEIPSNPEEETNSNVSSSNDPRYGIYDYRNVRNAKTRLLHDLNKLPIDILRETYIKNQKNQLKRSRFEQRDLQSHENRDKELIKGAEELGAINSSLNLWILESEKELEDKKNGYARGKRSVNDGGTVFNKITSTGECIITIDVASVMLYIFTPRSINKIF